MDKPLRRSAVLALAIPLLFPLAALLLDRLSSGATNRADGSSEEGGVGGSSRALLSAAALGSLQRALTSLLPTALLLPLFAPFVFALAVRLRLPRAVLGSAARSRTISTSTATDAARRRGLLAGSAAPHAAAAGGAGTRSDGGGGASGAGLRSRRGSRHQRGQTELSLDEQQSYGTGMQAHSGGRCRASSSVANPAARLAGAVLRSVAIVYAERITAEHVSEVARGLGRGARGKGAAAEAAATAAAARRAAAEGAGPPAPPISMDGGGGGGGGGGGSSGSVAKKKEFTAYCIDSVWHLAGAEEAATVRVWRRYRDFSRLCNSKALAASFASRVDYKRSKALFPGKKLFNNTAASFVSQRRARLETYLRGTFAGATMPCGEARQFFMDGTAPQSALPKQD